MLSTVPDAAADSRTPSELLVAAADRIRDRAAAAAPGPWVAVESDHHTSHDDKYDEDGYFVESTSETVALGAYVASATGANIGQGCSDCMEGTIGKGNAEWIALLSPAVAPALERLLRDAAKDWDARARIFTAQSMQEEQNGRRFGGTLALAQAILSEPRP